MQGFPEPKVRGACGTALFTMTNRLTNLPQITGRQREVRNAQQRETHASASNPASTWGKHSWRAPQHAGPLVV